MRRLCRIVTFGVASLSLLSACGKAEPDKAAADALPVLTPDEDPFQKGHLPNALNAEQGETIALGLNTSGQLCAELIGAVPDGDRMLVECKEYRTKKPETFVRYWISGLQSGGDLRVRKHSVLTKDGWQEEK